MNQVSTVGLDLAKYVFQLHGADTSLGARPSKCLDGDALR